MDSEFMYKKIELIDSLENAKELAENSRDTSGALAFVTGVIATGALVSAPTLFVKLALTLPLFACSLGMAIKAGVKAVKYNNYNKIQKLLLKKEYEKLNNKYDRSTDILIKKAKAIAKEGPTATRDLNL